MPESLHALTVALLIFAYTSCAAVLGMAVSKRLPKHHLSEGSKEVLNLVMGLIATMVALVLGLLVASAKSSYDTQSSELEMVSANVVELDHLLAHYGPDAGEARSKLRTAVLAASQKMWTTAPSQRQQGGVHIEIASFFDAVANLSPNTEAQRFIQKRALEISAAIRQTRALMVEQIGASIPWPFLIVLVVWISMLFFGFGLFAQNNATVMTALLIGALSVSSAIYLILELNHPDRGLMAISDTPLRSALAQIGE
jgi:hypothetical protein